MSVIFMVLFSYSNAAVKTVSNNTGSPGQYTSLQTAIDAAAAHDTIMVAGSATSYGNITFGKPLVLVGAGYNNPYGSSTTIGSLTLTRQNLYVSASGSKIMGFIISSGVYLNGYFTGGITATKTIDNVVLERCIITSMNFGDNSYSNTGTQTFNNDTVRNCQLSGNITNFYYFSIINNFNNIIFHNNIFNGGYFTMGYSVSSYSNCSSIYLKNNLFINKVSNCFSYVYNMIIENNIFYGAEPQGGVGCVFNNNITYMCINNTIPGSGNLGSGNLVNIDPQFVNFPVAGGAYSCSYDVHLKPSSPGKNTGTGGTDIGVYGGITPFDVCANPHFPQMMEISLPNGSSVPAGGVLDVFFKAKKLN